ncbi:unnamed protein product [Staurois parvus]|uniref:Uncharacterized protein n=1 Tax=Staurois parvus TaxID=386267 RepID=A0ABN9GNV7_9NEOB|nr:unnamed protein product [Staurois parvus]
MFLVHCIREAHSFETLEQYEYVLGAGKGGLTIGELRHCPRA